MYLFIYVRAYRMLYIGLATNLCVNISSRITVCILDCHPDLISQCKVCLNYVCIPRCCTCMLFKSIYAMVFVYIVSSPPMHFNMWADTTCALSQHVFVYRICLYLFVFVSSPTMNFNMWADATCASSQHVLHCICLHLSLCPLEHFNMREQKNKDFLLCAKQHAMHSHWSPVCVCVCMHSHPHNWTSGFLLCMCASNK